MKQANVKAEKEASTKELTELQQEVVSQLSEAKFDSAFAEKVEEVVRKAQLLAKLEIPKEFKQSKIDNLAIKIGKSLSIAGLGSKFAGIKPAET
jgi:hypothetical protein